MSLTKKLIGAGTALLLFMFLSVGLAGAHDFRTGDNILTNQNEVINETVFAFGTNIDISSEVFGDVICAGQTINISGQIHGDVICAGQTINISGQIDGDIRLASQTVTVSGGVDGNASVISQTLTTQSDGEILGDISVASELVTIGGPVGRDVAVAANNLVIANTVGRDIRGAVENIELLPNAVVGGSIEYTSENEINKSTPASVTGEIKRTQPEKKSVSEGIVFGVSILWIIYIFLAMLVTSMSIALLFPSVLQASSDRAINSPWKVLLIGLLSSLAIPAVLLVLGLTLVGIPLMIILALIWFVVIMLSGPFTAYYLGRLLFSNNRGVIIKMFAGSVLLLALYFIPIVGVFTALGAYWLGTGMIILELMRRTPKPDYSTASLAQEKVITKSTTKAKSKPKKTIKAK
jgi:hypothetical protein